MRLPVTESEWLASDNPEAMLRLYLLGNEVSWPADAQAPVISNRKLRLIACGLWWQIWPEVVLADKNAVLTAERFANGETNNMEDGLFTRTGCCHIPVEEGLSRAFKRTLDKGLSPKIQADVFRDVIGNPFRIVPYRFKDGDIRKLIHKEDAEYQSFKMARPRKIRVAEIWDWTGWLTWNNGTVVKMALAIYQERRWQDLPVLADALGDAGCTDKVILEHLRGEPCPNCFDADFSTNDLGGSMFDGEEPYAGRAKAYWNERCACKGTRVKSMVHARGCWVVDLLLGRS